MPGRLSASLSSAAASDKAITAVEPPTVPATAPGTVVKPGNALVMRGDYWEITYEGRAGLLEDTRGLRYIAVLVRDTHRDKSPMHAKELVARATGQHEGAIELEAKDYILDRTAETQLVKRVEDIGFERTRAEAANDFDRMAALEEEYEQIVEELSRGGRRPGGRRGAFDDGGEKARKAVGKAIREAVTRIAANADLAPLAQHFATTIRKGQWLSYNGSSDWQIEFSTPLLRK